jgi:hypothetical protein
MKTIFLTMPEIQEFVTVDISAQFKTISPYLVEAHKWALKGIDKATLDTLIEYANDEPITPDADLDALLPYVRRVVANFAYAIGVKRLGVYVGESGAMEFGNSNLTPLTDARLEQVKSEFFNSGYNAIEQLILFIQDNSTDYADSYSYLFDNSFFVSTAAQLNALIYTDVQNRDYFDMKPDLFLIEQDIEGIITATVMAELKAEESPDTDQAAMLAIIKPAEACLAYGKKFKSEEHILKGKQLLESLRKYYETLTDTEIERWSNEDKRIYVFGG